MGKKIKESGRQLQVLLIKFHLNFYPVLNVWIGIHSNNCDRDKGTGKQRSSGILLGLIYNIFGDFF